MHEFMYGKRNDAILRGFFGDELDAAEVFSGVRPRRPFTAR